MSTFTKEVLESFDFLHRAIKDLESIDQEASRTLTAITGDLVTNLESQMILLFANFGVKKREDEAALLRANQNPSLLEYYKSVCAKQKSLDDQESPASSGAGVGKNTKSKRKHSVAESIKRTSTTSSAGATSASNPREHDVINATVNSVNIGEIAVQKTLLGGVHLILESLAYQLQAERSTLYLAQKGTGTLRIVCSAPDESLAVRGSFIPSHQGIPGIVFSTGVAVRGDQLDEFTKKQFVGPVDSQIGTDTANLIAFPLIDPASGQPIAVVECANKHRCASWSLADESLIQQTCRLLWYMLCYHELDFHNGVTFNPAGIHGLKHFRPATHTELAGFHGASDAQRMQLVARLTHSRPSGFPQAKDPLKHSENKPILRNPEAFAEPIPVSVHEIKELKNYLSTVEEAHRQLMIEVVQLKEREEKLREEVSKKSHKNRLLSENNLILHQQVLEARQALNASSFEPVQGENAQNFSPDESMHRVQSLLANFMKPPEGTKDLSNATNQRGKPAAIAQPTMITSVMSAAEGAIDSLRKNAIQKASAALRSQLFASPQPGKVLKPNIGAPRSSSVDPNAPRIVHHTTPLHENLPSLKNVKKKM